MNQSNSKPKITAIVVNWNRRKLLLEAVDSLIRSDYPNLQVIVVDNGSEDGSADAVEKRYPQVVVIRSHENLGFAGGNNLGIERAMSDGTDYLFFLNNDATVANDALKALADFLDDHTDAGGVAPYIFYHYHKEIIWYGGGIVRLWRGWIAHRHIRRRFDPKEHHPRLTDYLSGCAFMVRTELICRIGGFDLTYGLYTEDVDLSMKILHPERIGSSGRTRSSGWKLWVTPDAKVYHRVSASSGGELSPFKAFHRGRSAALFVRRWARWWHLPTLFFGSLLGGTLISVKLVLSKKTGTAVAIWRGIFCGFTGRKTPMEYRLGFPNQE